MNPFSLFIMLVGLWVSSKSRTSSQQWSAGIKCIIHMDLEGVWRHLLHVVWCHLVLSLSGLKYLFVAFIQLWCQSPSLGLLILRCFQLTSFPCHLLFFLWFLGLCDPFLNDVTTVLQNSFQRELSSHNTKMIDGVPGIFNLEKHCKLTMRKAMY